MSPLPVRGKKPRGENSHPRRATLLVSRKSLRLNDRLGGGSGAGPGSRFGSQLAYARVNCPSGQSINCFQEDKDMAAKKSNKRKARKTGKKLSHSKKLSGINTLNYFGSQKV